MINNNIVCFRVNHIDDWMFLEEGGCFPLSFMERSKRHRHNHEPKREFIFGPEQTQPFRKTILLIGPKSSGKTALVNSFANFVNNVTVSAPYRLHITPVNDKSSQSTSMNYVPTQSISSYVFQHTPVDFPIALVDTPSLGLQEEERSMCSVTQIKSWLENDYKNPIEDLEIWFVMSAVYSDFTRDAEDDLISILDILQWKARIIPVITFAKKRKPILALRELSRLGFTCERTIESQDLIQWNNGVDYFTINNGSILGLSTELLEMNAVSFDEGIDTLRLLILSHREPVITGSLLPLHVSTKSESLKLSSESSQSDVSSLTPSSSPVKECDDSSITEEPIAEAPPIPSARATAPSHKRFKSYDEKPAPVRKAAFSLDSEKPLNMSHDSLLDKNNRQLPSYDNYVASSKENLLAKIDPLKRCKSEDGVKRKFGFVSISPYETLV